jgi:hypothetical protein
MRHARHFSFAILEQDVRAQLARPALRRVSEPRVRYVPHSELARHREPMGRFGAGLKGCLKLEHEGGGWVAT